MSTKIFKVDFDYSEKASDDKEIQTYSEDRKVVAKDAEEAIKKARSLTMKNRMFKDDDTGKMIKITRLNFQSTGVSLLAETD